MRTICITIRADRVAIAKAHFEERGVDATFFRGFDASALGVVTTRPYNINVPGEIMEPRKVGCWLSHRAVWAALLAMADESEELFLVLEDDVIFPEGWKDRTDKAIEDAGDFDVLFVGSCCTIDKPRTHVRGEVYDVRYPVCLHGLVIRRRALAALIETSDRVGCYAPIDISMLFHTLPGMRAYTVLPRILDQRGMDLVV